jgi:hypothetical protein
MKEKFKLLILLLVVPVLVFAKKGSSEYKRTIVKEFNNAGNSTLSVSNKYGKVVIHTWSKSSIKATIVITGYGKSVDEAKDVNNMVDIESEFTNGGAAFRTVYNPSNSGNKWFSWGSGKKDSKDYVNIDYEVYVPEDLAKLVIGNNFGDVITDVLSFPAKFDMNYCNYDVKEAQKSLDLNMNYCSKGKVGKAESMVVKANYSNVRAESVGTMYTSSNYSEYNLGSIGKLDTKGNYDEYSISKVNTITSKCTYTNFRINEVTSEITSNLVYSDLSVKVIGSGFRKGDMHLTYSDVKLGFQQNVPFHIKANLNNGDLHTGDLSLKNITSIKRSSQLSYTGSAGGAGDQSATLNVQGVYSDVHLGNR